MTSATHTSAFFFYPHLHHRDLHSFPTRRSSDLALGTGALEYNASGHLNTAVGLDALQQQYAGEENTAVGVFALVKNARGGDNTAVGANALHSNQDGVGNTAVGWNELYGLAGRGTNIANGCGDGASR